MGRRFDLLLDRIRGKCECCKAVTPEKDRRYAINGGFICRICMDARCLHHISPLPDYWEHRVGFTFDGTFIAIGAGR